MIIRHLIKEPNLILFYWIIKIYVGWKSTVEFNHCFISSIQNQAKREKEWKKGNTHQKRSNEKKGAPKKKTHFEFISAKSVKT